MGNDELIRLTSIGKTDYMGEISFCALQNVNLTIGQGESIAILGPSGSGKSTLMSIIGCLSTPTEGSYQLEGKEVGSLSKNELALVRNQKIGFVFQSFNLLHQINAQENVALPLVYRGVSSGKRAKKAKEILTKLGLDTHLGHRPLELSGGQQQRVAIARALVTDPDIILADEPTGNLDSASGDQVMAIFDELANLGKTVIVVTHDQKVADRAKRIIEIHDGKISQA